MIYFDQDNKTKLTERFFNALHNDGYFLTSANETIHDDGSSGVRRLFLENEIIYQSGVPRKIS